MKPLPRSGRALTLSLACLATVALLLACNVGANPLPEAVNADTAPAHETLIQTQEFAQQLSAAFRSVAAAVQPSVVSIDVRKRVDAGTVQSPFQGTPFGNFFDRFFDQQPGSGQPRQFFQEGLGSGFVISEDGYILTNHHVIEDAETVTVQTSDERELKAEVIGSDPQTDLAVLRVDAKGLTPLPLGDSDALEVGEWVVAVGNPFGLTSTLTAGIVSAKGRSRVGIADYEDFIQTDAAINPGNSGGPLVNLRGEAVGINTAIFSRSGGYMGIGFAIPLNMAKTVMNSLIADGRVTRGRVGAWIQDLNEDLARSFGFKGTDGVLINDVEPDGPAAEAGLKSGDIIVTYDGQPAKDADELRLHIASTAPGTTAKLGIFRDGRTRTVDVEIGKLESDRPAAAGHSKATESLGLRWQTLTPELADRLGYESSLEGAVVTDVQPFSPAADAGIQPRDVIVAVKNEDIQDAEDLRRALDRSDLDEGVRLTVMSNGVRRFVFLKAAQ